MYGYFIGPVTGIYRNQITVEVANIGYNIKVSDRTIEELYHINGDVKIYTYTSVREDEISLFGFLSMEELELFKKLITVNGVGPKVGLAILSGLSFDDLYQAIEEGDVKKISKIPGLGPKTAQRVILELKGKIDLNAFDAKKDSSDSEHQMENLSVKEAVDALVSLGYSSKDAYAAVSQIEDVSSLDTGEILKLALKYMYQ